MYRPLSLLVALTVGTPALANTQVEAPATTTDPSTTGGRARIEILPGFEASELERSAQSVVAAALACIKLNDPILRPTTLSAKQQYFPQDRLDGLEVQVWSRSAEYECHARPVRRCSFTWAWDESHTDHAYATVQCLASESGRSKNYGVTSTFELHGPRAATKKVKGTLQTALNFYTDSFPGTNTWASMQHHRGTGELLEDVTITQFDDFTTTNAATGGQMTVAGLDEAAHRVAYAACTATLTRDCDVLLGAFGDED